MTRLFLKEAFGDDLDAVRQQCVFFGDSPNDQPMFAFFEHSVGVANVRDFVDRMQSLPAYVTEREGGYGFAEGAELILAARG